MLSMNDLRIILIILAIITTLIAVTTGVIVWIKFIQKKMYNLGLKTGNYISDKMNSFEKGESSGKKNYDSNGDIKRK